MYYVLHHVTLIFLTDIDKNVTREITFA